MPARVDTCPACGGSRSKVVATLGEAGKHERFVAFDNRKYGGIMQPWIAELDPVVLQCDRCGHAWYREQPAQQQLAQLYEVSRPIGNELAQSAAVHGPTPYMREQLKRLRALAGARRDNPTLLDFGSGFGHWAHAAANIGFRVTAFEPSATRSGATGVPFRLVNHLQDLQGERFDAIQLEQVLEHVHSPVELLRGLGSFCDEHTVVRVTVPNLLRAPEGREIWSKWPFDGRSPHTLAPFEHLHGFTPRSLRALAERAGFGVMSGGPVWCRYPVHQARQLVGGLVPSLGTTLVLLRWKGR